jgi:16S rRNA processing protein RimM
MKRTAANNPQKAEPGKKAEERAAAKAAKAAEASAEACRRVIGAGGHSGAVRSTEPGIHEHQSSADGFRAPAVGRPRNDHPKPRLLGDRPMSTDLVLVAKFGAPHGVRARCASSPTPRTRAPSSTTPRCSRRDGRLYTVTSVRPAGEVLVARIAELTDRTAAERHQHAALRARERIPPADDEDEFLHADLIGLKVETVSGEPVGTVTAVFDFGAGDVIDVARKGQRAVMIPFTKAVVPTVDMGRAHRRRPAGGPPRGHAARPRRPRLRPDVPRLGPHPLSRDVSRPLGVSLAGRALGTAWSLDTHFIRDFATDRHRTVDDTPAGGGPGMVMKADVLARAVDHASPADDPRPRLYMSPRGRPLTQDHVRELAAGPGAVILCGRFEGIDERLIEARGLTEVSIGDYVLSGGEPARSSCSTQWCGSCPASWATRRAAPRRASRPASSNIRTTRGRRSSRA